MDFSFNEEQQAVSDLAARILGDQVTNDALKTHEASGDPFPAGVWKAMADAGLLGIALPEDVGGSGLGFLEACLTLEQIGKTTAPVPYFATVMAAMAQKARSCERRRVRGIGSEVVLIVCLSDACGLTHIRLR